MFRAILLENRNASGRDIAQGLQTGNFCKLSDQFERKTLRVGCKRLVHHDTGQFPVTDNAVLAGGSFGEAAVDTGRGIDRWNSCNLGKAAKTELLQVGQIQAAAGRRDVRQGGRILIAIGPGIGESSRPTPSRTIQMTRPFCSVISGPHCSATAA